MPEANIMKKPLLLPHGSCKRHQSLNQYLPRSDVATFLHHCNSQIDKINSLIGPEVKYFLLPLYVWASHDTGTFHLFHKYVLNFYYIEGIMGI